MSTRFGYASAEVSFPNGTSMKGVAASLVGSTLSLRVGHEVSTYEVVETEHLGRRGWKLTTASGGVLFVKREGGCGCRG